MGRSTKTVNRIIKDGLLDDSFLKGIPAPLKKFPKAFFITGTDTQVGKTVVTFAMATLLKERGLSVGVFKPVQCAGNDAEFLKYELQLDDPINVINPYFAREPLSPNLAFERQRTDVKVDKILSAFRKLKEKYDVVLVEGAGGLMVPITDDYSNADLVKELDIGLVIVSRLALGTINHTLLTVESAKTKGIDVHGIVFCQSQEDASGIPETTNPGIIQRLSGVSVLGAVPYLKNIDTPAVLDRCQRSIDFSKIKEFEKGMSKEKRMKLDTWDKQYVWHPFTQMKDWSRQEPLIIDEAKGCILKDVHGKEYLDGVSSLWVNVHGHGHKTIDEAITNQLKKLSHSTLLGLSNTPSIELAKRLVEITPKGLDKVFYSDSGATSVEIALKMSYQYWQNIGKREKINIVHFANSYHGDTLGSVSVGGIELFHKVYRNLIFKTIQVDFPDCYRAPEGKVYPDYAFECLKNLRDLFKRSHKSIASLVIEPIVQGAAGIIVWPDGVLREIAELCREHEVLLIADEVATGFGRTGRMFACNHENVRPDFLCLAKGLSGGYLPLAATLTTKRIYDGFLFDYKEQKTFFHGHTYTGNPLCCAAALANLDVFENEQTIDHLQPKIKFLSERLDRFYSLKHVGHIRQKGFMVGIELVKDKVTKEPYPWEEKIGVKVCEEVRRQGVILRPLGNVVVLMPPLAMTIEQLQKLLDVTYAAIETVT